MTADCARCANASALVLAALFAAIAVACFSAPAAMSAHRRAVDASAALEPAGAIAGLRGTFAGVGQDEGHR